MRDAPQSILTESRDGILLITIDRPHKRNALDRQAAVAMEAAADQLDQRDDLFIGIVTGSGTDFSAGADLASVARGERARTERRGSFGILHLLPRKPLIAAVEGHALGGGFELCIAADLVVASSSARFGLTEVRHNALALGGGLVRLQRRLPYNVTVELALTGTIVDAEFLFRWGFVNRLTAPGEALVGALELAHQMLASGQMPGAVARSVSQNG